MASGSTKIRLPIPDIFSLVFLSIWGVGATFGSLVALVDTPRSTTDVCGGALFIVLGVVALGIAAYWLLRIPSIVVDSEAQTIALRPLGPVLRSDKVRQIDVWREKGTNRRSLQISCRYRWRVTLAFAGGQEVCVWQGCNQDSARWVAKVLSEAIDKPWVGGREAGPPP